MNFLGSVAKRVFGSSNERTLKKLDESVKLINELEEKFSGLSDTDLRSLTQEFRLRYNKGETLDNLLVESFATVREAAKRTLGQRHYDVQLIGGMVLHSGQIAEMKTGEGKTLVATLAAYLNSLSGHGVHIITVNDYLAHRDAEWMGEIYTFLGLSTGCIVHGMDDDERRSAYAGDITYGTNNEFGFDYLRDNMKFERETMVQRSFNFAIVDEVDSILVDEARTPLIISGPSEDSSELYRTIDELIPSLNKNSYEIDEKARTVSFTEDGAETIENILSKEELLKGDSLYDVENVSIVHHINQALRAHMLFQRDVDYMVRNGRVIIIDEFTGRAMEGRRYSEGLHQALEAKENVDVQAENQTLASITFQNYFRLYSKLSGMTGTAMTEASEFQEIYNLKVIDIPTHLDMIREDHNDEVYRTAQEKYEAILNLVSECQARGQPVLVGTVSIEKSELLSDLLQKKGVKHSVLNARHHEQEAHIIAQAGQSGAVTIATNMAGRGTDIQLGGNASMRQVDETKKKNPATKNDIGDSINSGVDNERREVIKAGGLYIVGTERHESRRIDNQLRGRSGRQGDPGASKFFLSLEDDLMRIFGSERMDGMLRKLGLEKGEAIEHPWVNKALEKAQEKVEARNFDIRKNLLKFDDVMNDQRKVIYEQRLELMDTDDVQETVIDMRHEVLENLVAKRIPEKAYPEQWDIEGLSTDMREIFGLDLPLRQWAGEEGIAEEEINRRLKDASDRKMAEKVAKYGADVMRMVEKNLLLQLLDQSWKEHLLQLDHLRGGIGLRAYGQRDPLNEYKGEAFGLFESLLSDLRETVTRVLANVELQLGNENEIPPSSYIGTDTNDSFTEPKTPQKSSKEKLDQSQIRYKDKNLPIDPDMPQTWGKVPRNSLCPCGSNKKYKHCHGR